MDVVREASTEGLPRVRGLDHVELFVANARQAAHFYRTALGLRLSGYAGFENGHPDESSYLMSAGDVRLVLRGAVSADSDVGRHVNVHGDGVHDIAFSVDDAEAVFHRALLAGAAPVLEPTVYESDSGCVTVARIRAFGDSVHSFVQRDGAAWGLPPFVDHRLMDGPSPDADVVAIDHLAVCLGEGDLDREVEFYQKAFGFRESYDDYVSTGNTAMRGRIVENADGSLRLPLWEAGSGLHQSQVNEFVALHRGPGVQHAAFLAYDIVTALGNLRARGVEFVSVPDIYYSDVLAAQEAFDGRRETFKALGIVVDRDAWGYLLQAFTKPLQSRATFFWEVIERQGARSFGGGNIRRLFEAIEREQQLRGTY